MNQTSKTETVLSRNASVFNRDPVAFVRSAQAAKHPRVEVRYSCPCCGRDTKRPVGLCGRCLL
jgi:hypothetical protein